MSAPDRNSGTGEPRLIDHLGVLTDLIDSDWRDLHHSRNQDWKFWVTLGAIFGGVGAVGSDAPYSIVFIALLGAGMMIGLVAALISWNHTDLHLKKTAHIEWLESLIARELSPRVKRGLPFSGEFKREYPDRLSVGGLIFSTYATVCLIFAVGLGLVAVGHYTDWLRFAASASIGFPLLVSGVLVFVVSRSAFDRHMTKRRQEYRRFFCVGNPGNTSTMIHVASTDALDNAARTRGRDLVKLVVASLRDDTETEWIDPDWKVRDTEKAPVLTVKENYFEVSFANEQAAQEWHTHEGVYEIYISEHPFEVLTRSKDWSNAKTTKVAGGCAIVPPSTYHKVQLTGPTYVFQATADGISQVSNSKRSIE